MQNRILTTGRAGHGGRPMMSRAANAEADRGTPASSSDRKRTGSQPTVLEPPSWLFAVAATATALGALYFLGRVAGVGGPGLGLAPYMLLLLGAGVTLLPMSRDRVEVDEEKVVRYRGRHVLARCRTADITDLQVSLLARTLVFRGGAEIKLYDPWSNVDRVTAVIRKLLDGRARTERERQIRSGTSAERNSLRRSA